MGRFVTHDLLCHYGHGYMPDELIESSDMRNGWAVCPHRAQIHFARIVWSGAPALHGIVWSGNNAPERSEQLGTVWNTNAEKRAWQKENPHVREFVKGDAHDRRMQDRARNRADKHSRRIGYRDLEHRRKVQAKERAKGWKPPRKRGMG